MGGDCDGTEGRSLKDPHLVEPQAINEDGTIKIHFLKFASFR